MAEHYPTIVLIAGTVRTLINGVCTSLPIARLRHVAQRRSPCPHKTGHLSWLRRLACPPDLLEVPLNAGRTVVHDAAHVALVVPSQGDRRDDELQSPASGMRSC
jgi:hypothetical protein